MQSKLGYLLSGPLPLPVQSNVTGVLHACTTQVLDLSDIDESVPVPRPNSSLQFASQPSAVFMKAYQRDCISRDKDGSYIVGFPWKLDHPILPTNLTICERQARTLARKLGRQPELLKLYSNIIAEQEERNFIEQISPSVIQNTRGVHYLPHHPVQKNSPTTPVRIVYNCSFRPSQYHASLNDCLMAGNPPSIDLSSILLRFRLHHYALSTDIEKAFLHVRLKENDRDLTRFLWLSDPSNPDSPLITYRFKVVLFGSTSSPFMLNATLDHHLNSHTSEVSTNMKENLYVDNVISGCQSEEAIIQYYTTARTIMREANFNLRSWASNSRQLQITAQADHTLDLNTTVNLLGLQWNTCTDVLSFPQREIKPNDTTPVTKRSVLQGASRQYDPLGWLAPVTIRAKLLIQELWRKQVAWDDPLEQELQNDWCQIAADVENAACIALNRRYFALSSSQSIYLHVFADASTKAYGAVAYLQNTENVAFVMARSRVAPLKDHTLPKLELMAAVTAAQLGTFILSALQRHLSEITVRLWSDSQIVLHWIFSTKTLKQFVANRVREICDMFPTSVWRYCPTNDNAADLLTRGITATQLTSSQLWLKGPTWLPSECDWPSWSPTSVHHIHTTEEVEPTTSNAEQPTIPQPGLHQIIDITRYSKLAHLYRTTAYVLRFINNTRKASQKENGVITVTELNTAQKLWIKSAQEQVFANELVDLKSKSTKRLPLVRQLRLQLNKDGLIFCGGKIHNAPLSHLTKFPLLLPKKHYSTQLIIRDIHEKHCHAGTNSTVTYLREMYWIPAARQCVRYILKQCVVCNKVSGTHYRAPDPPPLPKHRVQMMNPFSVTGVDFTGALYIRTTNGEDKVYICLFTCANTRAVHLEVVSDLSEETFLQAFRRFASRKSLPQLMVSDNASTFMAAAEELKHLFKSDKVHEGLARR